MDILFKGFLPAIVAAFVSTTSAISPSGPVNPPSIPLSETSNYIVAQAIPPTLPPWPERPEGDPPADALTSCIQYGKWWFPELSYFSWGNAVELRSNTDDIEEAELILTTEGGGHIVILAGINATGSYDVWGGNEDPEDHPEGIEVHRHIRPDAAYIVGLVDLDLPASTWVASSSLTERLEGVTREPTSE